ncbi:MAG: hypothetical protein AAGI53_17210 [Planctomycetota bacterium]
MFRLPVIARKLALAIAVTGAVALTSGSASACQPTTYHTKVTTYHYATRPVVYKSRSYVVKSTPKVYRQVWYRY